MRGYMISATPFDAITSRRPGETRESLRTRGILIQGEDAADIRAILYDLKTLTEGDPESA